MALELAIPDSGPLISLGRVERLDLLDRFDCPIVITDMVADEVLRGLPGAPDAGSFATGSAAGATGFRQSRQAWHSLERKNGGTS